MLVSLLRDYANRKAGDLLDLPLDDAHFLLSGRLADLAHQPVPASAPAPSFPDFLCAVQARDHAALDRMGSAAVSVDGVKSALGPTSGPAGDYLVPSALASRILLLAAELALVRPRASVVPALDPTGPPFARRAPARPGPLPTPGPGASSSSRLRRRVLSHRSQAVRGVLGA